MNTLKQNQLSEHTILIAGAGAGGLVLATRLGNTLGKKKKAKIILLNPTPTHLWKPLIHEVAAGTLNSNIDEINLFAHAHSHYFEFQLGQISGLNRHNKELIVAPILDENQQDISPERKLNYDTLVIAIGSESNDFNVPGVKEHCLFLDSLEQADKFHRYCLKQLLSGLYQTDLPKDRLFKIAIVGGGATGVELAAELRRSGQRAKAYGLNTIDLENQLKITLIESGDRILSVLPDRISRHTTQRLQELGIDVYTNERVTKVTAEGLYTASEKFIPADLKVWVAGIKASGLLTTLDGLETNKLNQLIVKDTLQTSVDPDIFSFGDCAYCPQPNTDKPVPPRAQAAFQQANLLAKSLTNYLNNKPLLPYRYRDYGSLVTLSDYDTVGNLMGKFNASFMIEGKLARIAYLSLYQKHLIALHGIWHTGLLSLANLLTQRLKPRLKLH